MNAIDRERDAARQHIMGRMGYQDRNRVFADEVRTLGYDADILALPFNSGNTVELQDPTTGALYGMYDVDGYGASYAP